MKSALKEILITAKTDLITANAVAHLFPDQTRNAVNAKVKRCLAANELIKIQRGVYLVNPDITHQTPSLYRIAQAIDPKSFLTGMSALSFYGLVPDAIMGCVLSGVKKRVVKTPFGTIEFRKNREDENFFGVDSNTTGRNSIRIATPLRAIMDHLLSLKVIPPTRKAIIDFMRLDEEELDKVNWQDAAKYAVNYGTPEAGNLAMALNR